MGPKGKSPTYDEVQELANYIGKDIHIGSDGVLRVDKAEAISVERNSHSTATRGASGGCGQHENNLKDTE